MSCAIHKKCPTGCSVQKVCEGRAEAAVCVNEEGSVILFLRSDSSIAAVDAALEDAVAVAILGGMRELLLAVFEPKNAADASPVEEVLDAQLDQDWNPFEFGPPPDVYPLHRWPREMWN
jgi:hypothetical protein